MASDDQTRTLGNGQKPPAKSEAKGASAKRRPTIREVARAAEVSIGTVSAVINGATTVTEKTRQRVQRCITELGYEPNTAARSLKRQRSSSIGMVVPDLQNPFFAAVAEGAHNIARKNDVFVVLGATGAESRWEEYYSQSLRARRLDGMILLSGSGRPNVGLVKLVDSGSVVFVDETIPGLDAPFVSAENRKGARLVAQELIGRGHRKVAIVGGPTWLWTSQQRLAGYREALAGAGIDPDTVPVLSGDYTEDSGYAATKELFERYGPGALTGIIYANDLMAIGGAKFLKEKGVAIPQDVSIVGFDDIISAKYFSPPLTTVAQPGFEMGQAAAEILLHKVGLLDEPEVTVFPTEVKVRQSVAQLK
ncbi:LacI family DNA-binding transcriptional regulator [Methyloligella sp. 2.7D]|uniref:LacI family DNA-binding transcriptional regulator n=1 Tax=unclassified Methyloligella TaxID=2625955 RepID=UPI00157DBFB0|nr:LacI family DNA-binding transcriptional regulator [Methyloligella sp. GL2]QKP76942.1 LacI family DNA-binding transcriptional regulator [Methyloligella sp. GL2]